MKRFALLVLLLAPIGSFAGEKTRPLKVEDLFRFQRVADPQISPDGKWVVYTLGTVDDVKTNKSSSTLWLASNARFG